MKQFKPTLGFILLTVGIFTFTGCSKYDEGPGISIRSKKSRVVGDWKVTELTEDGVSFFNYVESDYLDCMSGDIVNYNITSTINDYSMSFNKDGGVQTTLDVNVSMLDYNSSYINCTPIYITNSGSDSYSGKWEFSSDKEELKITDSDGTTENWKIIELKEKEMKLELHYGSSVDKMTLEKK
jgi:hypothetical protein